MISKANVVCAMCKMDCMSTEKNAICWKNGMFMEKCWGVLSLVFISSPQHQQLWGPSVRCLGVSSVHGTRWTISAGAAIPFSEHGWGLGTASATSCTRSYLGGGNCCKASESYGYERHLQLTYLLEELAQGTWDKVCITVWPFLISVLGLQQDLLEKIWEITVKSISLP